MKKIPVVSLLVVSLGMPLMAAQPRGKNPVPQAAPIPAGENDKTLQAMRDELERSRTRLQLPGVDKPFYIEYRLLDVDVRSITASFGALMASDTERSRFMSVDVRVGNYHLDSSNFISEDGFQGFLGSTGQVGPRLQLATAGSMARHRSGLQSGCDADVAQERVSAQPYQGP